MTLKNSLARAVNSIIGELEGRFVEIPSEVCSCGKPIVFVNGKKKFTCSHCGARWILRVEVKRIPTKQQ